MNRFSDGFLQLIRDRLPLSDIVGRRVSWDRRKSKPARGDHWACCPFHGEKTPSFHVDDRKGRYHCFGCEASGDHFRFLMETEGLSFPEAVERLAGEAGIAMPAPDPQAAERQRERLKQHDVLDLAARYFERSLTAPEGRDALAYAERRGLDAETRSTFRIGFAPDRRDGLIAFLRSHEVSLDAMVETGLVIVPEEGQRAPYDRFRGRLMVAIEDARGKVVGFGGRVLGQGEPKYLNSPETPLFRKREMLFNLQRARAAAHTSGRLVVVEGYMDAIALHRAGLAEVTASLGTALGEEQIALMWRFVDEPIICFDGDEAGERAAHRVMDRALPLLKPGKSLRFLFLPDGMDPDDFLAQKGRMAFDALLDEARPFVEAVWDREAAAHDVSTPERMAAFQADLSRLAATIGDATVRAHYDEALRDRFFALRRALRAAQNPRTSRVAGPRDGAGAFPTARVRSAPTLVPTEQQLLALAQRFPERAMRFADRAVYPLCSDPAVGMRIEALFQGEAEAGPGDAAPLEALPFPILRLDASPRFIDMLITFLLAQLELRALEAEIEAEAAGLSGALDEAQMERALALQDEARGMRGKLAELEALLDEEATLLRSTGRNAAS